MKRYFLLDELASNIERTISWADIFSVKNIIIVSRALANNELLKFLWRMWKPGLYNIDIIYPERVANISIKRSVKDDTLFIFENMDDIVELIFKGLNPADLFIGRMPNFGMRRRLLENIYLSPVDYKRLILIQLSGVNIYLDPVKRAPFREIEGIIRKIIFE